MKHQRRHDQSSVENYLCFYNSYFLVFNIDRDCSILGDFIARKIVLLFTYHSSISGLTHNIVLLSVIQGVRSKVFRVLRMILDFFEIEHFNVFSINVVILTENLIRIPFNITFTRSPVIIQIVFTFSNKMYYPNMNFTSKLKI
ncbi:unnamed protein product [Leptidea sinapis]|uniref:Uncharacterized protein n=1 Tax=Leptidea sinapis TaxID=189913 RepID=A0A5E4QWT7_9NEOP|nr:unnamed protein product [Leptidea sinapis]